MSVRSFAVGSGLGGCFVTIAIYGALIYLSGLMVQFDANILFGIAIALPAAICLGILLALLGGSILWGTLIIWILSLLYPTPFFHLK